MPIRFDIPAEEGTYKLDIDKFLGIDTKNLNPEISRAQRMYNFINNDGLMEIRPVIEQKDHDDEGYLKYVGVVSGRDWFYDVETEFIIEMRDLGGSISLKAYELDRPEIYYTDTIDYVDTSITSASPYPFYTDVLFDDKKYIFTPAGPIAIKNAEIDKQAGTWGVFFEVENLLTTAKIPTTCFGRTPDGLDETAYEDINLLTRARKNSFLGTAGTTAYTLRDTSLDADYVVTAEILQSGGTYTTITEGSGLTVNNTTGVVTFGTAPGVSPIAGQDNVIITYAIASGTKIIYTGHSTLFTPTVGTPSTTLAHPISTYYDATTRTDYRLRVYFDDGTEVVGGYEYVAATGVITFTDSNLFNMQWSIEWYTESTVPYNSSLDIFLNCKFTTVFGYEGDKRVFVSDGSNTDIFSAANDITYFPDTNYTVLGDDTEIIGYGRQGGYLFTFKLGEDSCHVRYGSLINNVVVFPAMASETNLNTIGAPIELPNGEMLVPTADGLESIWYTGQKVKHEVRSYYIDNFIPKVRSGWEHYTYNVKDNKLYISFLNKISIYNQVVPDFTDKNIMLVADLNQTSYVKQATNSLGSRSGGNNQVQYEWYVWTDVPYLRFYKTVDIITGLTYELWHDWTTLFEMRDTSTEATNAKVDTVYVGTTKKFRPIEAYRETPFIDFNDIIQAKTVKNININTRSKTGDCLEIGYILPDGTVEILEKLYGTVSDVFPKLVQIKTKINKFMNVKLYVKNKQIDNISHVETIDLITSPKTLQYSLTLSGEPTGTVNITVGKAGQTPIINSTEPSSYFTFTSGDPSYITISESLVYNVMVADPTLALKVNYDTNSYPYVETADVSNYKNTTFNRILIEYQKAGKYRGD